MNDEMSKDIWEMRDGHRALRGGEMRRWALRDGRLGDERWALRDGRWGDERWEMRDEKWEMRDGNWELRDERWEMRRWGDEKCLIK